MGLLRLSDRVVDLETGRVGDGPVLRPVELRLLRFLAERPGQTIGIEELMVRVWGTGPRAEAQVVYSTLYRMRKSLEADPKAPVHLITVRGEGVRLDGLAPAAGGPKTNLEPVTDSLVGRTDQLEAIAQGFPGLVSLLGPGGVGKTRLAREHALKVYRQLPGGAWFCDLTLAGTVVEVAEIVAATLGLSSSRPVCDVGRILADWGPTLIVLDNLDVVGADIAACIDGWRAHAPELHWLVTSQQPLALPGEVRIRVDPLEVPTDPEDLGAEAAVLLVERMRALDPDFDPDPVARDVVALLAALEGLPLAIEVAAAHAVALSPAGVHDALKAHGTLVNRRRGDPDRHQSLHAVVAWSWERLPPWGRAALLQLDAFATSFTAEGRGGGPGSRSRGADPRRGPGGAVGARFSL